MTLSPRRSRMLRGLALLVLPCLGPAVGAADNGIGERIDAAYTELRQGRLEEGARRLEALLDDPALEQPRQRAPLFLALSQACGNLGRYIRGLEAAREALSLYGGLGDRAGLAEAHFRVGAASDELAAYDDSHRHYQAALDLYRKLDDRAGQARALSAFGTSYRFLGDPAAALSHYEAARDLFAELGQPSSLCWAHRELGVVLEDLDRSQEAEAQYRQALRLLGAWDHGWIRSDLLFHLARLQASGGAGAEAVALFEEGLPLARSSQNHWAEARLLVELAQSVAGTDPPRASSMALEGLRLLESMGAQDLEWEARFIYASLLEAAGEEAGALEQYLLALETLERIRSSIGLPLLRSRYIPRARKVYESVLQLQARWPPDLPAEERALAMVEIAERNRARAFAEMLIESRMAPSAGNPTLQRRERTLRGEINALRTTLTRFAQDPAQRAALERALVDAERDHRSLLLRLRREDPRYARVAGQAIDARGALARLPDGAHLLAYHLGERGSFGWHVGGGVLTLFELPPRAQIENQVLIFRSLIRHRNDPAALRTVAGHLFGELIEPALARIGSGQPLVIVPDGALFQLPFEVLMHPRAEGAGGSNYLIQEHRVHYAPSLNVLAQLIDRDAARDAPASDLTALGNPGERHGTAPPLRYAEAEVRRIAGLFPDSRVEWRVGPEAGESAFVELAANPTRILHVAAHGNLFGADPHLSGLWLETPDDPGPDGFLGLYEILNLHLGAQLVVLSGCDTARGELLPGEGVLGLTRAFLFSGAQTVVASLWKVDDRSTEQLMVSFYEHLQRGRCVAEALRQAKVEWIEREAGAADPFPWGGFVVIGNGELTLPLHGRRSPAATAALLCGAGLLLLALGLGLRARAMTP